MSPATGDLMNAVGIKDGATLADALAPRHEPQAAA
jgi:hypothetical protein